MHRWLEGSLVVGRCAVRLLGLAPLSILPRATSRWPRASAVSYPVPAACGAVRWVDPTMPKAEAH